MTTRLDDDVLVTGNLGVSGSLAVTAGAVGDAQVASGANIDADKLEHLHVFGTNFGLEETDAPSTSTTYIFNVFQATGACTVRKFSYSLLNTGSQANTNDFTFELKKGAVGSPTESTILSANPDIDSDTADNTPVDGTLSSSALVAGDRLAIEVTTPATITGALGMYAWVELTQGAN